MLTQDERISKIEKIEGNRENLYRLLEQLKTTLGIIPFVGAGLSIPFGFPGWTGFLLAQGRKARINDEVKKRIEAGEYEEAAEDLLEALGHRAFHDDIENAFGNHILEDKELKGVVSLLPQLTKGPIITTNFDHLLERVFKNAGRPFEYVVWGAKSDMVTKAYHQNRSFLLKIHGDVEDSTDRVLTRSDYKKHYGDSDPFKIDLVNVLPSLLCQMLISRPVLFLGCSLNQDRTMAILGNVVKNHQSIAHYAIVEKPSQDGELSKKARYLSKHGIRPIWYPEGRHDLIEPLLEYLTEQLPPRMRPGQPQLTRNRLIYGAHDTLLSHRSGFYGRREEIENIVRHLSSDEKIATVTVSPEICSVKGAPGIGKTEVCKEAIKRYLLANTGKRVYYVELSEARDEAGFLARLVEAFGFSQVAGRDVFLDAIRTEQGIIYLDNLEDVIADKPAIELLTLLAGIPGIRVLASSRETLPRIAGNIPIRSLGIEAAVQLFLQEWKRSDAGSILEDSEELRVFLEKDLSCHPLSIVLVAAQAYQYGSFTLLRDGWNKYSVWLAKLSRGQEDTLSNLEVSLSLSFNAVLKELQEAIELWGVMGLFPEGLSVSAWEMLFRDIEVAKEMREVLLRLNIIDVDSQGTLLMLAPLRQFILDKAKRKEDGLNSLMLADMVYPYFNSVAKEAYEHMCDETHMTTLDLLLTEFPNMHHFIFFAGSLGGDWPRKLSNLSFYLYNYYQFNVLLGQEILLYLLKLQTANGLTLSIAHSSKYLGDLESRLGKVDEAQGHYKDAIELYRKERDNLGLANAIKSLGDLESRLGKVDEAQGHYKDAIELYRKERANLGLANVYQSLGDLERARQEFKRAKTHYIKARELYIEERENMGLAYTCSELARVSHALNDLNACDKYLQEAIVSAKASNVPSVVEYALAVQREIRS
ncbi:Tetratricopeptide (TPR) repeat [Methanophagales archaeon]|nr:Tetratricopeptide (TPR) repeat [Methanophagales archaeon]